MIVIISDSTIITPDFTNRASKRMCQGSQYIKCCSIRILLHCHWNKSQHLLFGCKWSCWALSACMLYSVNCEVCLPQRLVSDGWLCCRIMCYIRICLWDNSHWGFSSEPRAARSPKRDKKLLGENLCVCFFKWWNVNASIIWLTHDLIIVMIVNNRISIITPR